MVPWLDMAATCIVPSNKVLIEIFCLHDAWTTADTAACNPIWS
jgi:hypothetical protein